jgi:hypothetical protein
VNCDLACELIDGYLDKALSRYDARRLEQHLSQCPSCSRELRERPLFERTLRGALAVSVQQRRLSPKASMRIVREAQGSVRRGIWSKRAHSALRIVATIASMCLVLAGLFYLLRDVPRESNAETINLFPMRYLSHPDGRILSRVSLRERTWLDVQQAGTELPALGASEVLIEPWTLTPGQMFTTTVLLQTDLPQPVDSARFDLDVNGPTGYYSFGVKVRGHLPSQGFCFVQITPDLLEASSREKYLMPASEIFREPGVYKLSISFYSPVYASTR